jgi:hypothetical protein
MAVYAGTLKLCIGKTGDGRPAGIYQIILARVFAFTLGS